MRKLYCIRMMKMLASGAILMQAAGCALNDFMEFLQTAFLGVTAAGSVAILQNI